MTASLLSMAASAQHQVGWRWAYGFTALLALGGLAIYLPTAAKLSEACGIVDYWRKTGCGCSSNDPYNLDVPVAAFLEHAKFGRQQAQVPPEGRAREPSAASNDADRPGRAQASRSADFVKAGMF